MSDVEPKDAKRASGFSAAYAVVIAIANYKSVNRLPDAVLNDGRDVHATLCSADLCGFDPQNVKLLLDNDATLANIRKELDWLAGVCQGDSTAVIYFSGHGAVRNKISALLPVDCDLKDFDATSLKEAELSATLRRISSRRLVALFDACHSGGAGILKMEAGDTDLVFGYEEKALADLAQGTGRVIIASSRATETSLVLPGARNSVFTEHLLAALQGRGPDHQDGLVRIFDVFTYTAENVRRAVPGRQHPIFKASDVEDNFPIALAQGGKKEASPTREPAPTIDGEIWSAMEVILAELYPLGPTEEEIWSRAGGDLSRVQLKGTGRSQWFSALRTLRHGGGGPSISRNTLIRTVLADFPRHPGLQALSEA